MASCKGVGVGGLYTSVILNDMVLFFFAAENVYIVNGKYPDASLAPCTLR